jgi:hypothetical protein
MYTSKLSEKNCRVYEHLLKGSKQSLKQILWETNLREVIKNNKYAPNDE